MNREEINDKELESVVGGTIIFSGDHKTCGYNCNNQYKVNNFQGAVNFINKNTGKMSENSMLKKMLSEGILSSL